MTRETVLGKALIGEETLLKQAAMVLGGSLLIAMAAQVSVPFYPVPMTLQTLAILVVGLSFGARLGAATLMAYLAQGAVGLPVFAGGMSGLAYMAGPTAGFLLGFVAMAWLAGLAAERGIAKGVVMTSVVALVLAAALYIPGLAWPAAILGKSADALWTGWMAPFLLGDAVKAVIAALVVTAGLKALKG